MPRGKMLKGGEKKTPKLPPNEIWRFPSAGLCKAAPAPLSAGSQLALGMPKGKWIFSTPASQSKLVGTQLLSVGFSASRSCCRRTKQLPPSNRLPRHGFFSSVLEKKTCGFPRSMPTASIQVRDLNTRRDALCFQTPNLSPPFGSGTKIQQIGKKETSNNRYQAAAEPTQFLQSRIPLSLGFGTAVSGTEKPGSRLKLLHPGPAQTTTPRSPTPLP